MQLPVYQLSIDDEFAQDGEYLGTLEIANTATPAIKIKGLAFSATKEMIFKDDLKYRIASPVLTPGKIFRRDKETGEEYYANIEPEVVEKMFVKFQKDRAGKDIFNLEHDEGQRVPSYILETWMVDNPEKDKSLSTYGIECPKSTWFAVQQFTDKDAYHKCIENGQVGFSIHGNGALHLSAVEKINTDMKSKFKAKRFVAQMTEAVGTDSGEVIVTADVLEEGAEVVVLDENFEVQDNFTGDVIIEDVPVTITDNVITSIATEETAEFEASTEKPVEEVEMATEEVVEEEVEMADEPATSETYTRAEVDAKFDEVYQMIADLKADGAVEVEATEEEKPKSASEIKMSKVNQISKFLNKKK